ncbi:hypothetical protein EDC94DRAFT_694250 [Helicostylum pulchrum]|nr:hypothetical protein EDC94DRAFT_694250 [Helicostylum pulchrum]
MDYINFIPPSDYYIVDDESEVQMEDVSYQYGDVEKIIDFDSVTEIPNGEGTTVPKAVVRCKIPRQKEYKRARALWESTLVYSGFDFEYRLATRLNFAIQHAIELGVPKTVVTKADKGKTIHGRKRMSIVPSKSFSTGSTTSS